MSHDPRSFQSRNNRKESIKEISAGLNDLYNRASKLNSANWTMKQKRDHSWKLFADIGGGPRPRQKQGYTTHLRQTKKRKRLDREDAYLERKTGEFDALRGSALKKQRKSRIQQRVGIEKNLRQTTRKLGNPHKIYSAGKMNFDKQELEVRSKLHRKIKRKQKHQARMVDDAVKMARSNLFR
mmetsp:Transcript_395/g.669  ORF Transcript_395/g.669 Transcript_395/m.669 type:complete len:182 (-) Transcript_395:49-594(-)